MVSEVDAALGRLLDEVRELGAWDDTLVIVTADHGNMLGDHGLDREAGLLGGELPGPGHRAGPPVPRAARHRRRPVHRERGPHADDLRGDRRAGPGPVRRLPADAAARRARSRPWWRTSAHWEFDWRSVIVAIVGHEWPWDRTLERQNLAVVRTEDAAYVHFGDGSSLCFDLAADPTWRTPRRGPRRRPRARPGPAHVAGHPRRPDPRRPRARGRRRRPLARDARRLGLTDPPERLIWRLIGARPELSSITVVAGSRSRRRQSSGGSGPHGQVS